MDSIEIRPMTGGDLEDNARAIGFYEHMGFSLTGCTFTDEVLREAEMLLMR
ncbi:hypothetical protein [Thermophilibacter provencensis]|uniref:hypothetical protein n=1 Tax=Thermophilibacter provencensis TaxID=1852386 RepID=UPI0013566313|nr:hypothetical protein [Thermophilibacter provencensis]